MTRMDTEYVLTLAAAFGLGYFFARLDAIYAVLRSTRGPGSGSLIMESQAAPRDFFTKERRADADSPVRTAPINIDTRTVVTHINTAGIEKGSDVEMGTTTAQEDTLQASVSKLANLKGR